MYQMIGCGILEHVSTLGICVPRDMVLVPELDYARIVMGSEVQTCLKDEREDVC